MEIKLGNQKLPVRKLDSASVSTSPVEEDPNLALVYFRTRPGPQGPTPLHYLKGLIQDPYQMTISPSS